MLGYSTIEVPLGKLDVPYPTYVAEANVNARPSSIAKDANEIDDNEMIFPAIKALYPILVVVPTLQKMFFDKAPFFRIMDESVPSVSVVIVCMSH